MTQNTVKQIRNTFIDYFKKQDHIHVASSPLIPHNDPTLMFVNSGMVQFKDIFTGAQQCDYKRAVSAQKSVRAGGKHNDLDNVGYTARHHTFFEMLGNFSFGDYFKEQAIYYAFELLTKEYGLPKEKLYITTYHHDDEAAILWKKISGFSDEKIIKISTNDNFWSMGDIGPCGPSSEIFYDHGDKIWGGLPGTSEAEGDRYVEIWNLVFMQYEQIDAHTKIDLPHKSVDTGMGLERIAAVLQGVHNNYDIDLFTEIIGYTESILRIHATDKSLVSYRVIADHLRSAAFLIADGVMPSNEGRGYVLRRIMRRAMRHSHQLGAQEPLMYRILPKLVELVADAYPEIKRAEALTTSILKQEEERFKVTLSRGLKLLEEESLQLQDNLLSGEVAFKLYDTYGFPLDLTQDILRKQQILIDHEKFAVLMQEQKLRARNAWSGSGEAKIAPIWFNILSKYGQTEFLGYTLNIAEGNIIALIQNSERINDISVVGTQCIVVVNQTPFYAESGGQMGDIGIIESESGKFRVLDTLKYLGQIHAHICLLESGKFLENDIVKLSIDTKHRSDLRIHHSATHLLHSVMRVILGKHITQKGSLVAKDRLRFDVNHPQLISVDELNLIEDKVNQMITENSIVNTCLMPTEAAIKAGAMALFGEKYDSEVRVVTMRGDNQCNLDSVELCGGTHVLQTGDIGIFKIISESSVAAGVRRIEAVCGEYATKVIRENEQLLVNMVSVLKTTKSEILKKIDHLLSTQKELEQQISQQLLETIALSPQQIVEYTEQVGEIKIIYRQFRNIDPKIVRIAAEKVMKTQATAIVVYLTVAHDKASLIISVTDDVCQKYKAGVIAKEIAPMIGGNGGGQASMAQVGGISLGKIGEINSLFKQILQRIMSSL